MTTTEQWIILEESYTANVQSKLMELREQFQTLSKEILKISQYMLKAKTIIGTLDTISYPTTNRYLLLYM